MPDEYETVAGETEEAEGIIHPADDVEEVAVMRVEEIETVPAPEAPPTYDIASIAQEVIAGQWGKGQERRNRLSEAGYNVRAVEEEVTRLLNN